MSDRACLDTYAIPLTGCFTPDQLVGIHSLNELIPFDQSREHSLPHHTYYTQQPHGLH
ncbi:hypothetical protein J2753_002132 [Halolamina salifodinae]|uniref:Uncharacterized protein n=1 Tax=Halolamina salifodinae TaxID=1202767 RepID=A0A8T4GWY2_9EURY|nr:hypothetical protein [Halolamina salifodinae]